MYVAFTCALVILISIAHQNGVHHLPSAEAEQYDVIHMVEEAEFF